ncbi:sulfate adenylyltransferase [Nocardioides terrae]|uniref:Adenylyl-sulfate kinase n=1 Tax=Nocardioides terrae TaxID=574651 RepID=A0A1I1EK66_9ACTN|nr:adenylyl-sulfate kinase [Nocardioides terrae]SFB87461.1 sulfate adenylyltransferase [Nocardioides terrae]
MPAPQFHPTQPELDDLELIASGALPGPLSLQLPAEVEAAAVDAGAVELVDPEGLPLASVAWPSGEVSALARPAYGPFRRLYLTPAEAREQHPDGFTAVLVGGIADRPSVLRAALAEHGSVVAIPVEPNDPRLPQVLEAYGGPAIAPPVLLPGPKPAEQGLVVFFTGLSGSGKSTLARALVDLILEQGARSVTSLDGDVVRRNLSAGLTFSKEDRETNIRRIGWVAAEISRHGGVAICSPIAPFDATRQDVRSSVADAGGAFFLVHVATPLEECERRDRKGLYAKARAGEIPEFTGISSPYEAPADADVVVDTTGRSVEDALGDVLAGLRSRGYLDLANPLVEEVAQQPSRSQRSKPLEVLFVCTANICRSPFMELTAQRLVPDETDMVFSSAGTRGFDAAGMDPAMAARVQGDTTAFRSRPLTRELLDRADLVLTAEASHRTFILDEQPGLFRKVFTLGQLAAAIQRQETGLPREELLARLAQSRGSADPALDVTDPYRRGPEAAAHAAARIERLLDVILPALARQRE